MQKEALKFTQDHEWIYVEDNVATVGVSQYAIDELGEIVFVELPETSAQFQKKEEFGTIESVKTVSSLYTPISGEIIQTNATLSDQPDQVNSDPYDQGWLIKLSINNEEELEELMSYDDYEAYLKTLAH